MPMYNQRRGPIIAQPQPQMARANRHPRHTFQLRSRPFEIQPFMIAPVIPGETMKSLLLNARTVTDPLVNKMLGWWCGYYFFYVKHSDLTMDGGGSLTVAQELEAMMLDPAWNGLANIDAGADSAFEYTKLGQANYVRYCLMRVVEEYFRHEGEDWNIATIGTNVPAGAIQGNSWLDSAIDETSVDEGADPNASTTMESLDAAMRQWELLRQQNIVEMSYEDFLRSYGVRGPSVTESRHRPELIRWVEDWTYPTNTVEPTTGVPSSAAVWSTAERADKDRYFPEPGWIFGVQCVRPKVYLSKQKSNASTMFDNLLAWLPPAFQQEGFSTLREYASNAGPLQGEVTNGYLVDLRDLLLYGDQFVNFALDEGNADGAGSVALPTTALAKRYPSPADVDALFVGTTAATRQVETDGVVSLTIASRAVREFTPQS